MKLPKHASEEVLEGLVDSGQISERQALHLLENKSGPRVAGNSKTINGAQRKFAAHQMPEEDFYKALLAYITTVVKSNCTNASDFVHLEDAISLSATRIWRDLAKFDSARSSFARYVTVVTLSQIRNLLAEQRALQGSEFVGLEEAETLPAKGLSPEQQTLFKDWMRHLGTKDRDLAQLLMDGLTYAEVGQVYGISLQAVGERVMRLRKRYKPPF